MRYPAAETAEKHARILDEAAKLFRKNGFSGAGVSEIMKAAGLTHGGFYSHFASKTDLSSEVLGHVMEKTLKHSVDGIPASETPSQAKQTFITDYLSAGHCDSPETGCAMPTLATEVGRNPALRPMFSKHLKRLISRVTSRFGWKAGIDQEQQAIALLSSIVGALVLARAVEDKALSDKILQSVRDVLTEDTSSTRGA
ncbi:TetR/AcrR family transcriptional regulator [Parasedimentitalea marina]|uniref:TetR/AcrR family transcriptional regulator n=1 Tax=Parasedimentitalea marina TaxID=2483033 RepID=A0A3T0MZ57_9RHOB|nr:TetR/AcrR family transcriptional regulator [Parasedimentitalea marina]AZV77041.1 TetR/AcrR family transcriptional regulator [Parasedimentitalea marina]